MKTNNDINLKKTYVFAAVLLVIGTIIFSVWFFNLLIYFLIAGSITIGNYYLLERINNYKAFNQVTVYATLMLRYFIYVVVAFVVIWLNRERTNLEYIGISLIAGFSIIQISTILNALTTKGGASA